MSAGYGRSDESSVPRYVPEEVLPPYSYVTGRFPHPTRDPAGHRFGVAPHPCPAPDPNNWQACRPYLWAVDLFNHGYYWEAHEEWEGVWHACGRSGVTADFIKGLIKLGAAGVKAREGRPEGVQRHARRAAELFQLVAERLPAQPSSYFGLSLSWLQDIATGLGRGTVPLKSPPAAPVEIVFPFALEPHASQK